MIYGYYFVIQDLIPVSSTVIPLSVYEVSYGTKDGKLTEEEYKKIYLKHKMHKKVNKQHQEGVLEKLVTGEDFLLALDGFLF